MKTPRTPKGFRPTRYEPQNVEHSLQKNRAAPDPQVLMATVVIKFYKNNKQNDIVELKYYDTILLAVVHAARRNPLSKTTRQWHCNQQAATHSRDAAFFCLGRPDGNSTCSMHNSVNRAGSLLPSRLGRCVSPFLDT